MMKGGESGEAEEGERHVGEEEAKFSFNLNLLSLAGE